MTGGLAVEGVFALGSDSILSGSGSVDAYGGLTIDATTSAIPVISGTTLNNHSSATLETGWPYSLYLNQGATIDNLAGASFTITGSGGTVFDRDSSAVAFNNAGTLTCDVAVGGTFDMSAVAVANTGSVVVQQGSLYLGGTAAPSVGLVHRHRRDDPGPVRTGPDDRFGDLLRRRRGDGRLLGGGELPRAGGTFAQNTSFTGTVVSLGSSLLDYLGTVSFAPASGGPVTLTTGALTLDGGTWAAPTASWPTGLLTWTRHSSLTTSGVVDAYGGLTIDAYSTLSGTTLNNHGAATLDTTTGPYDDLTPRGHDQQPGR